MEPLVCRALISTAWLAPIWRRDLEPDWFKQQDIYRAEHDGLDSLDVNAILGNEGAFTPRNSNANSEAHTASIDSTTQCCTKSQKIEL